MSPVKPIGSVVRNALSQAQHDREDDDTENEAMMDGAATRWLFKSFMNFQLLR